MKLKLKQLTLELLRPYIIKRLKNSGKGSQFINDTLESLGLETMPETYTQELMRKQPQFFAGQSNYVRHFKG